MAQPNRLPTLSGYAGLALAVGCISIAPILVRLSPIASQSTAFWRLACAGLLLAPFVWRCRRDVANALTVKQSFLVGACGALLGAELVLWHVALDDLGVATTLFLVNLSPVFVVLISLVTGRLRPCVFQTVSIVLALIGLQLFLGATITDEILGVMLALSAALCYALYLLGVEGLALKLPKFAVFAVLTATAAMAAGLGIAVTDGLAIPQSPYEWIIVLLAAAIPHCMGQGLFLVIINRVKALTLSLAILLQPVLSGALAFVFFGETLSPRAMGGALLILCGLIGFEMNKERRAPMED